MRLITVAALLLTVSVLPLRAAGPILATDDFDSGSLGEFRVVDDTKLVFVPRTGYDQDSVNSALTWWYGRLTNVKGREVTIEASGLHTTVYNGRRGENLPFHRNTVNVFSYDREHWQRFTWTEFSAGGKAYRMKQIFSRDTVWVAYIMPYSFSRMERMLREVSARACVRIESMGRSVEGRPLYVATVEEPGPDIPGRPVVWIVARQHAFETGGSWSCEGLLRWLSSDEPEARAIRRRVTFRVCPMLNPDGVVRGHTRFNAVGVDLNRHWNTEDPLSEDPRMAPEIVRVRQAMAGWKESRRLDLFVNIHCNDMVWNEGGDYMRYAPLSREKDAARLESLLREHTVFTGPYEKTTGLGATEHAVAREFGCMALLMELKTGYLEGLGRWTGRDVWLEHGPGVARAAVRWLEGLEKR